MNSLNNLEISKKNQNNLTKNGHRLLNKPVSKHKKRWFASLTSTCKLDQWDIFFTYQMSKISEDWKYSDQKTRSSHILLIRIGIAFWKGKLILSKVLKYILFFIKQSYFCNSSCKLRHIIFCCFNVSEIRMSCHS